MEKKRVAIIGAGASGLPAIKSVLEEGMIPVCFEKTDDIGGLWKYTPEIKENGQASVMKSTVINTSKEMMCYSDFPIPEEYPNFMHNTKVVEYFRLYAKEFDLMQHIRFNTEVEKIDKAADFDTTGRWNLKIKDKSCQESEETFDAVMVCTGHHGSIHWPKFPGAEEFQGKQVHAHDYKDFEGYQDKRVVIIGLGNSGGDIAVELARCAKQVYLSTRRGSWVINRVFDRGLPVDLVVNRAIGCLMPSVPPTISNYITEGILNKRFDHAAYGLKPEHRFNAQHPTVNDDLPNRIICGSVIVKPNIKRLTKTGVEFEDGTYVDNIDAVIYATGYIFGFPFIDDEIIKVEKNRIRLYKYVFPPELNPSTLAIIGCFQPLGAVMPISEMQCRWVSRVFKGLTKLPSHGKMWEDIVGKEEAMRDRYIDSQRHTIQVDFVPFIDEIAQMVGCKPSLNQLISDPKLAWYVYFGPASPLQFRLFGPHSWPGARHAIMTTWDRVYTPLKTRKVKTDPEGKMMKIILLMVILYIVFVWVLGF